METGKEIFSRAIVDGFEEKYREGIALSAFESAAFSHTHARRMSSILGNRVKYVPDKRTKIKRAALAALIAAAILLAGCTTVVYKEQIGEFFTTVYETYIKGSFVNEENANDQIIEDFYIPTYIPDGYQTVKEQNLDSYMRYEFNNDNGAVLIFEQATIDSADFFINNEDGYTNSITFDEKIVYSRVSNGTYAYIWNNEKYAFSLYCDTDISEEEIKRIIEGIKMIAK